MNKKKQLILDIQNLLNTYDNTHKTTINPALLEFMDYGTLVSIIDSLLTQKENSKNADLQWLETFKNYNN